MNIQTIPRDDKVVKSAFVPKLDAFFYCDYPNIELKFLAYFLEAIGHPSMADVFRNGADHHIETAAGIFGFPVDELTRRHEAGEKKDDPNEVPADLRRSVVKEGSMRQVAKRVNFSIVYGGGVPTLIEQLDLEPKAALDLLKRYHGTWPGIGWATKRSAADPGTLAWWIDKRIRERGYVTTLWGRHLRPHSPHVQINALCQGTAADLMKWALRMVHRWLKENGMRSHLVNVVHDELQIDADKAEIEKLAYWVPRLMTDERVNASVPIVPVPEISYGTWADKTAYTPEDS